MSISAYLLLFLLIVYLIILMHLSHQWENCKEWVILHDWYPKSRVTILIPVRNEATHISACIESLLDLEYPKDLLEIFVIDDYSDDDTVSIVSVYEDRGIKCIKNEGCPGKKGALEYGVGKASSNIIMCTDGDCIVPVGWAAAMVSFLENENKKFATGPVKYTNCGSILESFQMFDGINNAALTCVGINRHLFYLANGANMAFLKSAFLEVGGYCGNDHMASGDDVFLINKMSQKYPGGVGFLKSKHAIVKTMPQKSWTDFVQQRIRWATKSMVYSSNWLMILQGAIFVLNLCFFVLPFVYPFRLLPLVGMAYLFKIFIDWYYFKLLSGFFELKPGGRLVFSSLLYIPYIILVGLFGLMPGKSYVWKGRRVR